MIMNRPTDGAPASIDWKLQQAVALHQRGQLSSAQRLYQDILSEQPLHFDALHLLGVIAAVTGELDRAVDLMGRAIEIDPNREAAHNNRGTALLELGLSEAALAEFDRAVELKRDYAEAHYNRANALRALGRWDAALAGYDRALQLRRDFPEAWSNRGIVLAELKRWDASLASYDAAIGLNSDFAQAHFNRANVLCEIRQWDAALAVYDRAIALKADYAEAHCNRGFALNALQRLNEALVSLDRAIEIRPNYAEAFCNRGSVLQSMLRVGEALESYDRAIALKSDYASGYVNRALGLLLAGQYEMGWADYEWRWKDSGSWVIKERRNFSQPLWLGKEDLSGKTILLQSEQGYGDTIQFCRYVRLVADLGARVILEVPQALSPLLESLDGLAQLVVRGESLPSFDYYCPLLSLPLAMGTTLADIPARIPYVAVNGERRRIWRQKIGGRARPRVGLVWSGGFRPDRPELWSVNERRNVALAGFEGFADLDVEFYSLQLGQSGTSEISQLTGRGWRGPTLKDFTSEIRDFADTAALIDQLDLVISVDTSTAHLAGALGKPVWILNRFDTCWRWLIDRDDSPWYPTARLYRQERPGDWPAVLEKVRIDFRQWASRQP
jgi:tetratricopeptide (TPR) repeat protein